MTIKLFQLEKPLKIFISTFVIVLSIGVIVGLTYLNQTTNYSPNKAVERFNGTQINPNDMNFDIPDSYPKPISEMLITTHNHIIGFSLIIFTIGIIFYFNSILKGRLKLFLMIEPLFSTILTFGSIWGMRYISKDFVYLAAISSVLLYLTLFLMIGIILYECILKKADK